LYHNLPHFLLFLFQYLYHHTSESTILSLVTLSYFGNVPLLRCLV
jgi:hypothetical protein